MRKLLVEVLGSAAMNGALWSLNWIGAALFPLLTYLGLLKTPLAMLAFAGLTGFCLGIAICVKVARSLGEKIGHLYIERAVWGFDKFHELDMTDRVRKTACNDLLLIHHVNNTHMEVHDPAPGKQKKLTVWYSYSGVPRKKVVKENTEGGFSLP